MQKYPVKWSSTCRDLVVVVTEELSKKSEETLTRDGWKVKRVPTVMNPGRGPQDGKGYPDKFYAVYTKLYIFQMTEYRKVVFLDADIMVIRNMDSLFSCPGFCASLRHSERFNSGVMSLEPSKETFEDMMKKIKEMPSYTGGDQGFLNSYFSGFAHSPLFDPETSYTPDQYKDVRARLGPDAHGYSHGESALQLFAERWLIIVPWLVVAYFIWRNLSVLSEVFSHMGNRTAGEAAGTAGAWLA